jgi:hypothetical protein
MDSGKKECLNAEKICWLYRWMLIQNDLEASEEKMKRGWEFGIKKKKTEECIEEEIECEESENQDLCLCWREEDDEKKQAKNQEEQKSEEKKLFVTYRREKEESLIWAN